MPEYEVTYGGIPGGSQRPVLVDGVGKYRVGEPVSVTDGYAQAHGFKDAETMVEYLFGEYGIYNAVHARRQEPRWSVTAVEHRPDAPELAGVAPAPEDAPKVAAGNRRRGGK